MPPGCVCTPERVSPLWQYAVARNHANASSYMADRVSFNHRAGRLLNQRKKIMTRTAGTNGPHQASRPNALSVEDPPLTNDMIAAAQAKALIRFSVLNLNGRVPAYAHAIGMAVRRPGRKRLTSTRPVSFECTCVITLSRYFASFGYRSSQWIRPRSR